MNHTFSGNLMLSETGFCNFLLQNTRLELIPTILSGDYSPETTTAANLNHTDLYKYQWDYIHNPQMMLLGFLEDESEGAAYSVENVKQAIEKIRYGYVKNTSVDFIGNIKNEAHANNVKLLNGKTYSEIVFLPNKVGTITFNPKVKKEEGKLKREPDVTTGKESIKLYEDFSNVLKLLFTANGEEEKQEFEDYLFPDYKTWFNQIEVEKRKNCIANFPTDAGYIFQVDSKTGETLIYKTRYTLVENKEESTFSVFRQNVFFNIRLISVPEVRVIREFWDELVFSFDLSKGSFEPISTNPKEKALINNPILNENVLILSNPTEALEYINKHEPLITSFYEILKYSPELAQNGELEFLSKWDKAKMHSETLLELIMIYIESRIQIFGNDVVSLPGMSLSDIFKLPPEVHEVKTYIIDETKIDKATEAYKNALK